MKIIGIIPARYDSTRFPGKPLVDILGKTMIERVYRQCLRSKLLNRVVVATDDERILKTVQSFGGDCVLTRSDHISGTDRVAEACQNFSTEDIVINIQGDEPLIDPHQIDQLASKLMEANVQIGTLVRRVRDLAHIASPNVVKVVCSNQKRALYFSRSVIPFDRNLSGPDYWAHVGLYGYSNKVLQELTKLPPGKLEMSESLEQLRWLENDYLIHVVETEVHNFGIDTPEDLEQIKTILMSSDEKSTQS